MSYSDIYTNPSHAMDEYLARQGQRSKVEEWFADQGLSLPCAIAQDQPTAVWARQVATGMYCDYMFQDLAAQMGFTPLWAQWVEDTYDSRNEYKYRLLRRVLAGGRGRSGGLQTENQPLVGKGKLLSLEGQRFSQIVTDEGPLVSFHQGLRTSSWPCQDLSSWILSAGANPKSFYLPFLATFLAHAILVENFHESGPDHNQGDRFTLDVFRPAFFALSRRFGIRPIIVRLPWHENTFHYPRPGVCWKEQGAIPQAFLERVWRGEEAA